MVPHAAAAAAKIEELLEQHQLSLFDVQAKTFGEEIEAALCRTLGLEMRE